MKPKNFIALFICFLIVFPVSLFSQSGPEIKVVSIKSKDKFHWKNSITVTDPDGLRSVSYMEMGGHWVSLPINEHCPVLKTFEVDSWRRISDIIAEDCEDIDPFDTINRIGNQSQWHHEYIVRDHPGPVPITVQWMLREVAFEIKKPKIISVEVVDGNVKDKDGGDLDKDDFVENAGNLKGFTALVRGKGTVKVVMDPPGDLNYFVFDIHNTYSSKSQKYQAYIIGFVVGLALMLLILLLFRSKRGK